MYSGYFKFFDILPIVIYYNTEPGYDSDGHFSWRSFFAFLFSEKVAGISGVFPIHAIFGLVNTIICIVGIFNIFFYVFFEDLMNGMSTLF